MVFIRVSSPHTFRPGNTGTVMLQVLLATVPGVVLLTVNFGFGTLLNIALASLFCLGFEAFILKLRRRNIQYYLKDYSALVTAVLLGISLPPYLAWWLVAIASFFAIVIAKQLYGGLGLNPFNPAMVGYVVLLISFPLEMSQWQLPLSMTHEHNIIGTLQNGLAQVFFGYPLNLVDSLTGATPLDIIKQNNSLTLQDLYLNQAYFSQGAWAGLAWEWVNLGFLLGGIYLLYNRIFTWHAPISMLITLSLLSAIFYDGGSSSSPGSPLFHLLSGATMFGAFFIVTDPVTSSISNTGRIVYGACIGVLIYVIRVWGNYPDAIAFAVLLMNFAAPFIDHYTQPRTYGHKRSPNQNSDV